MTGRTELETNVGMFSQCWSEAWHALRPRFVLAMLPLAAIEAIWLWALSTFPRPPLDTILVPAWYLLAGEPALHYPEALAALPRIAGWSMPLLVWLFGVPTFVYVLPRLPAVFLGQSADSSRARGGLGAAWIATLPGALAGTFGLVAADAAAGSPTSPVDALARELFALAFLGVGLVARMLFAYALPSVVLGGLSPARAWRRSVEFAVRYLGLSSAFVLVEVLFALALRVPPAFLLGLFERTFPGLGLWVAGIGLLGAWLGTWFLLAATTRLYLHRFGVEG
ncbi:MAG: hypothetical protein KC591_04675 [Gemmatimonadetes bacterium]|nr:hypothetical protein [Gemmatimonadota bacterium]